MKLFTIRPVRRLADASALEREALCSLMESSADGLDSRTAAERLEQHGCNRIRQHEAPSWRSHLLAAFINPFIGILALIGVVTLLVDILLVSPEEADYKTIIVVSVMILISVTLRFVQEFRSTRAAEKLRALVTTRATVLRSDCGRTDVGFEEVVPGDVIFLSAGDMIPADCRVLTAKDLFVNQSVLTGESLPVEKAEQNTAGESASPFELTNICLMGTNVVSGSALVMAVNTGPDTTFGAVGASVAGKRSETSFDRGINRISWLLIRFMLVMVPLIFLINGLVKHDWFDALLFAIAVAVGLTPEMLPMIVTANLAKGAVNMSRHQVIIKRLNSIQNIGAMDVLCTDKTGTLTLDRIVLEQHINIMGYDDDEVLSWAYLNSFHQTGVKSLLDSAILSHAELNEELHVARDFAKIDEIPFDFQRRRLSVVLEQRNGRHLLICKGAAEEMLAISTHAFDPGEDNQLQIFHDEVIPLDATIRERILRETRRMNEAGMRVLLLGIREFDAEKVSYSVADESELVIAGLIGFLDPPKPSAAEAIARLGKLGVGVKVLTGDNEVVTRKICGDVGIPVTNILQGLELDLLSDAELTAKLDDTSIYCKLSPLQKSRVVQLLQKKGHTVGFLGDGINDAAALKQADVGISVDTATDIAKESADMILLENDLNVLRKGVVYGRRTFGNILKYIKMTTSSNFGNMFSMLGASIFLPFLPMLPAQLLLQNLLYDLSQISIPWDRVDEEYIHKPQKWDASFLTTFIGWFGPVSSLFDYATFAVLFFVFRADTPAQQGLFQSGWFVEGLLSQTLVVHLIRTRRIPFIQSRATWPVMLLTAAIMAIGVGLPFSPAAPLLGMQPLPGLYFPILAAILVAYAVLTQQVKGWFIRRYNVF